MNTIHSFQFFRSHLTSRDDYEKWKFSHHIHICIYMSVCIMAQIVYNYEELMTSQWHSPIESLYIPTEWKIISNVAHLDAEDRDERTIAILTHR